MNIFISITLLYMLVCINAETNSTTISPPKEPETDGSFTVKITVVLIVTTTLAAHIFIAAIVISRKQIKIVKLPEDALLNEVYIV